MSKHVLYILEMFHKYNVHFDTLMILLDYPIRREVLQLWER